jgi:hypothetical protein
MNNSNIKMKQTVTESDTVCPLIPQEFQLELPLSKLHSEYTTQLG